MNLNKTKQDNLTATERTTVLANERTYAAWVRTGLTSLATGLGSEKFLGGVIPDISIRCLSMIMFSLSCVCFILAAWRYRSVAKILVSTKSSGAPIFLLVILSLLLVMSSLIALIGVWIV